MTTERRKRRWWWHKRWHNHPKPKPEAPDVPNTHEIPDVPVTEEGGNNMAGTSGVEKLDVVFADVGEGTRAGVILKPEHDVDGELKASVDVGGSVYTLGYRAPKDRDAGGAGLTFWLKNDK